MLMITTRIPLHDAELRQLYVDDTNSIMKNLSRPELANFFGHSYVSIKMCIADYLGNSYLSLKISSYDNGIMKSTTDSKFRKNIRRRATYCYKNTPSHNFIIMTGVTWSDDFEPNSMSKVNRGSV